MRSVFLHGYHLQKSINREPATGYALELRQFLQHLIGVDTALLLIS